MKTTFKLITIASAVLFSSTVFAASTAGCAGAGAAVSVSSGGFIVNPFSLKCSANVFMNFDPAQGDPTNSVVTVCAASAKGNRKFGGSSDGGAVKEQGAALTGAVTQTTPAVGAGGCT